MPGKNRTRGLHDISHLFISGSTPGSAQRRGDPRTSIISVFIGNGFKRAYTASGLAAGIRSEGAGVTLLELGRGLPNAGYYFGLEPEQYLAGVIDPERFVIHTVGSSIRYLHLREEGVDVPRPGDPETGPHVYLTAVWCGGASCIPPAIEESGRVAGALGGTEDGRPLRAEGVLLFDDGAEPERCGEAVAALREGCPEAVLFIVLARREAEPCANPDELIVAPEDFNAGAARRVPPSGPFFRDLCASVIQAISSRRRRSGNRAG